MTTAQVVETSVTVNNNSPIQDYVHPDDQTQPSFEDLFCCAHIKENVKEMVIQSVTQAAQKKKSEYSH